MLLPGLGLAHCTAGPLAVVNANLTATALFAKGPLAIVNANAATTTFLAK